MRRIAAALLCLAAAWLLYGAAVELFVLWYSGSESDVGPWTVATWAAQVAVNAAALVLGWRIARAPSRVAGPTPRRSDMALSRMSKDDLRVIRTCMACVAAGDVILHDSEFQTVMGIDVAELRSVLAAWPDVDGSDEVVRVAIHSSLVNLLGYPHGFHDRWDSRIPVPKAEVERVFAAWRARS